MALGVQGAHEQALDRIATKLPRRETDMVNDEQINRHPVRAGIHMR